MYQYNPVLYYVQLLSQVVVDPVTPGVLKILVDAGVAVILSLSIGLLAYSLLQQVRSKSKDDDAENKRLTTVLEKVSSLTDAVIGNNDRALTIIEGNSETQRLITTAINENTGISRQVNTTMEGVRFDLKSYASVHSDSIEQLTDSFTRFESHMVAFGGKLDTAIDHINHNAGDHTEITKLVQRAIEEMLNTKLELLTAIKGATPAPSPNPIQADITIHTPQAEPPTLPDVLRPTG